MATPAPVLDITTTRTRPTVRIDQVEYPLRTSHDLTLDVYKTLERLLPRISALLALDGLSPADGTELGRLLDQVCRIALVTDPSDDIHRRLVDLDRLGIFQVFLELLTPNLLQATRVSGPTAALPATGPKPSRASSASTAAPSRGGSQPRRSASSGRA